jgi:hypothetical protein
MDVLDQASEAHPAVAELGLARLVILMGFLM